MSEPPITESENRHSRELDRLRSEEIVDVMCAEDATVAAAVRAERSRIAEAIDRIAACLQQGGRLIYVGAGTSGRLGILDAAECPPTFGTDPERVVALIAGGAGAMTRSIEGAEDRPGAARCDLAVVGVSARDAVVGISASGRTPYVLEALEAARTIGAATIGISCVPGSRLAAAAEIAVTPLVGPEVIAGSTRLKAGTATKLVLNMLSTGAMVRLGKVHGNLMVDLRATNTKLRDRARRIVCRLTGASEDEALRGLEAADWDVKTAVVMGQRGVSVREARKLLAAAGGRLRAALGEATAGPGGDPDSAPPGP